jgi:hypothetical protein
MRNLPCRFSELADVLNSSVPNVSLIPGGGDECQKEGEHAQNKEHD